MTNPETEKALIDQGIGPQTLDIKEIQALLHHRYPFLLVDRVLDYQANKYLHAIKNVCINEPYFSGHFPSNPIMPGVLVIESMAQACGLLCYKTLGITQVQGDINFFLAGLDRFRIRKPVLPGDQLDIHVELLMRKRSFWRFRCEAKVDQEITTEGDLMIAEKSDAEE